MEVVRTNKDLEGWRNGLKRRAIGKSQLPLYVLIQLLQKKASLVALQVRLVSDPRLRRHQRTTYKNMQKNLFNLWSQYENGEQLAAARGLLAFSKATSKPGLHDNFFGTVPV